MPEVERNEELETQPMVGERLRSLLRITTVGILGVLLIGDIFMYSLYQALRAQTENHDRKIERLNRALDDLRTSNANAEKIEKIKQQVDGIDGNVTEMTATLKAQDTRGESGTDDGS